MKVMVHTCCGPCLLGPLELLARRGYEVVPFFYNPNVHPFREYRERYFAALDLCEQSGLALRAGPYDMETFLSEVSGDVEGRCRVCYRLRLSRTAAEARTIGIGMFATTLLVSPYQDTAGIIEAGQEAAIQYGVLFLSENMSDAYSETARRSREMGMYRQSYCGCVYSEKERYQKGDPPAR